MLFRLLFASLWFIAVAPATTLYFFGDSLTDTGNVLNATSALNRYTFGLVPRQPTTPYFDGRFSNGPVWAEHVSARLGRPNDAAPAGMSMGWFGETGGSGNNYAVGGARTDEGGALGLFDLILPTGIETQVDFYLSRTSGTADPNGLYFLLGGGNDLRDAARLSDPTERMLAAQQAGANLAWSVRDLYLAGARQFVLINSPDIGLIPETRADGIAEAGTNAAMQFNTWFAAYGNYLRQEVPGFALEYFDLFSLHRELVAQYGTNAIRPCKSQPESCGETLFFDSIHPTAWVHEIIAQRIADQVLGVDLYDVQLTSDAAPVQTPEPSTAMLTICGLLLARVCHRRLRSAA